jgi:hypothetical protein
LTVAASITQPKSLGRAAHFGNFEESHPPKMAYFRSQFGGFSEEFALYLAAVISYHNTHRPV